MPTSMCIITMPPLKAGQAIPRFRTAQEAREFARKMNEAERLKRQAKRTPRTPDTASRPLHAIANTKSQARKRTSTATEIYRARRDQTEAGKQERRGDR